MSIYCGTRPLWPMLWLQWYSHRIKTNLGHVRLLSGRKRKWVLPKLEVNDDNRASSSQTCWRLEAKIWHVFQEVYQSDTSCILNVVVPYSHHQDKLLLSVLLLFYPVFCWPSLVGHFWPSDCLIALCALLIALYISGPQTQNCQIKWICSPNHRLPLYYFFN